MTYETLYHRLTTCYEVGEAKALVRWVLDVRFGLSLTDIICGKVTQLSADDQAELEKIMQTTKQNWKKSYEGLKKGNLYNI